jgi:hypothetical protein
MKKIISNKFGNTLSLFCTKPDFCEIGVQQFDLPDINYTTLGKKYLNFDIPIGRNTFKTSQ